MFDQCICASCVDQENIKKFGLNQKYVVLPKQWTMDLYRVLIAFWLPFITHCHWCAFVQVDMQAAAVSKPNMANVWPEIETQPISGHKNRCHCTCNVFAMWHIYLKGPPLEPPPCTNREKVLHLIFYITDQYLLSHRFLLRVSSVPLFLFLMVMPCNRKKEGWKTGKNRVFHQTVYFRINFPFWWFLLLLSYH